VYNSFEAWQKAYDDLAGKVTVNGKMNPETKLEKLKALHDSNKYCMEKLSPQVKVEFIKRASERRDQIMGG